MREGTKFELVTEVPEEKESSLPKN